MALHRNTSFRRPSTTALGVANLPCNALPIDLFRLSVGALVIFYFAAILQDTDPLIRTGLIQGTQTAVPLWVASALGLFAGCALIAGSPGAAVAAWLLLAFTRHAIVNVTYLYDQWVMFLIVWAALLPAGRTLAGLRWLRKPMEALRSSRAVAAPGLSARLFCVCSSMVLGNRALFVSDLPEWNASVVVHVVLAALPLIALWRALARWAALAFSAFCLVLAVTSGHNAFWLSVAPAAFVFWSLAHETHDVRDREPILARSAAALGLLVLMAAWSFGTLARSERVSTASRHMLAHVGLAPARESAWLPSGADAFPRWVVVDEAGGEQPFDDLPGIRGQLAMTYVGASPWIRVAGSDQTKNVAFARQALASVLCASAKTGSSRRLDRQISGPTGNSKSVLRTACTENGATLVPTGDVEDVSLRLASDEGFEVPTPRKQIDASGAPCTQCHSQRLRETGLVSAHSQSLGPPNRVPARARPFADEGIRARLKRPPKNSSRSTELQVTLPNGVVSSHPITAVVGAGRQAMAFVTRNAEGIDRVLPFIWTADRQALVPTRLLFPAEFGGRTRELSALPDVMADQCLSCHAGAQAGGTHADPAFSCETCHGVGVEHADRRQGTQQHATDPFAEFRERARAADEVVCGRCHGLPHDYGRRDDRLSATQLFFGGPEDARMHADGAPRFPSHQLASLELSPCRAVGGVSCVDCHRAHAEPPSPAAAASRCGSCHESVGGLIHERHQGEATCVSCHMPTRRLDTPFALTATDHRIAVPRPGEAQLLERSSVCESCHAGRDAAWSLQALQGMGASKALEVRASLAAIESAKQRRGSSPERAKALAASLATAAEPRLQIALLRLLRGERNDPSLVESLSNWAAHENPEVRAAALLALLTHDAEDPERWHRLGRADEDPRVRLQILERQLRTSSGPDEEDQRRYLRDVLDHHVESPTQALVLLSTIRASHHELTEAAAILRLAEKFARPSEREGVDAARERLQEHVR